MAPDQAEAPPPSTLSEPWVLYRVQVWKKDEHELLTEKDTRDPTLIALKDGFEDDPSRPILQKITKFESSSSLSLSDDDYASIVAKASVASIASYSIEIFSVAIMNALRSVVHYYPEQELSGDSIVVKWPYPILVHYYDELAQYRDKYRDRDSIEICTRNRFAYKHLDKLLQFLDKEVMTKVKEEKKRYERGYSTWAWEWVTLRPGTTVIHGTKDDSSETLGKVFHSMSGGTLTNPPTSWEYKYWSMSFDGRYIGRIMSMSFNEKYDGEISINQDRVVDVGEDLDLDRLEGRQKRNVLKHIDIGRAWWGLLRKGCRRHRGTSRTFPFNEVSASNAQATISQSLQIDGLVQVDLVSYYTENRREKPTLLTESDCRVWTTDCPCSVCSRLKSTSETVVEGTFERYNYITLETCDNLTLHQYLICPTRIPVFVFRTRTWGKGYWLMTYLAVIC